MNKHILTIATATILTLTACGNGTYNKSGLTPLPDTIDLKDEKLVEAVTNYVQEQGAPPNSVYDFVRVDLNNDGNRDGIVLFKLPHSYWCGWGGCGMLVLKAGQESFATLSTISNVRGPIYVSDETNQGWRDIIIRISGERVKDKNVILKHNGTGYPETPLLAPTLEIPLSVLNTKEFFR